MTQLKFMSALGTTKGITTGISYIRATGKKLDDVVHAVACAIIVHAKEHGDCSHALELVRAMPASARRSALIRWFTAFSPISVTFTPDVKKQRVGLRKPDMKNYNEFNVDGARANPYYEWDKSEENALAALLTSGDINEMVVKLADRIQRQIDADKVANDDKPTILERVKALRLLTVAAAA